jgi:DNA-binding NarL/FixJ family response regulator
MKPKIKVVLAEDVELFRDGFRLLLEKEEEIEVSGEAENGVALIQCVKELRPDVVITDIEMPVMNGIDATREIMKLFPSTGIIALTIFGEDHFIIDMLEAGARGYLLKTSEKIEVTEAIKHVYRGGFHYCSATSTRLTKMLARSKVLKDMPRIEFSEKEIEIIRLICEQYATKEIASITKLTHKTVEKYRNQIMEKTNSKNVTGIVVYAVRHGLYKV